MSDSKNILITGSTSGIGLETARHLHKQGYKILLTGRNEEKLINISKELSDSPYVICDLENTERIKEIFDFCQDNNIKLDGMIHAAGYAINMPIRLYKIEHMERQMKIHYYAFLELCKNFYSVKISNNRACIIAISSLASQKMKNASILYSSSKNALNTAIIVASKEFIKRNIRVNGLMPAYVDTRMNEGIEELINVKEQQPMGLIPPQNIAEIIEFLLSEKAKYITGALIPISAGMEF